MCPEFPSYTGKSMPRSMQPIGRTGKGPCRLSVFLMLGSGESCSADDTGRDSLVHAAPADHRRRDVA